MKKNSKILLASFILFGTILAWVIADTLNPFNDQPFDRAIWLQGADSRIAMAKDVISRLIHDEMSRDEVIRLIGEADEICEGQDSGGNELPGVETLKYYLGSSGATSFLGMDDAFVYVHLDDKGKVIHKEINGY